MKAQAGCPHEAPQRDPPPDRPLDPLLDRLLDRLLDLPLTGYLICPTAHSAHSRRMALNRSPYSSAIRP